VLPRSSSKMLQAMPLVESGAADAFGLTGRTARALLRVPPRRPHAHRPRPKLAQKPRPFR
jgi:hypothetical protein